MDYNEVLQRARARMAPRCKVCPECNGLGCGNTMPGPAQKRPATARTTTGARGGAGA